MEPTIPLSWRNSDSRKKANIFKCIMNLKNLDLKLLELLIRRSKNPYKYMHKNMAKYMGIDLYFLLWIKRHLNGIPEKMKPTQPSTVFRSMRPNELF